MKYLKKVISGAQTGADQAGLFFAEENQIETGGWIPAGGRTQDGYRRDLIDRFNLNEHESSNYALRTSCNVRDSDGTLRIASNFGSAGERCTIKAIKKFNKPYFDVNRNNPLHPEEVAEWIIENKIEVLNVAGNSESTSPGIFEFSKSYLSKVLVVLEAEENDGSDFQIFPAD